MLHKFREENIQDKLIAYKIDSNACKNLVRNTFYTWVQKYQYRVARRPMLLKSLTFWGNNIVRKGFSSLKINYMKSKETRKNLRSFWCIKAAIALIDNISIYDKIAYPSQALNLPIRDFDERQLSITVSEFNRVYKQKLFQNWKSHYLKIRNKKAKLAYAYVRNAFVGWKDHTKSSKAYREKICVATNQRNQKTLKSTFNAMVKCLKQQLALKSAYSR